MSRPVVMLKRLAVVGALLLGCRAVAAAEPVNVLALTIAATAEHPRNSEGAFATLRSGRIVFCYSQFSGGHSDFSPCRIAQVVSDDQGKSWSEPRVLFVPEPNTMEMSVSLLRLASGKLALFSAIKHGTLDCRPYLRISEDDGETWSAPRSLIDAPGYFVLNNDRVIQTSTGRLIMPLAFHRGLKSTDDIEWGVDLRAIDLWYYSDDDGATWKESRTWWTIPVASKTGLQEPGVVELTDGSLFSWARTDQGFQYGFRSADRGETWSAPTPTQLRSPASPASIKRLPQSDHLLAVFTDYSGQFPFVLTPRTYSGRTPLVASISADRGVTWRAQRLLENDPQRDYCYTAIHFTGDAVLLAYMANGATPEKTSWLCIRRMSLPWLCAPEDELAKRAKTALHDVFDQEESWVKIHAAEALVAGGEAIAMREKFLALRATVDALPYRVGVWRVLANTSPTIAEREACVAEVEKIYLNSTAPDRPQALETLCKLRTRLTGATLERVRQALQQASSAADRGLPLWALRLAGGPGTLDGFTALLESQDVTARLIAAYALRLLGETDAQALRALAKAAKAESPETKAYPFLLSAAVTLNADPARLNDWRAALERVLATGTADARFEASHGLRSQVTTNELPTYAALLDGPGNDTRVGAALTILNVRLRE
ncbi:MAG: sialidase family protein [Opitutus sp.]